MSGRGQRKARVEGGLKRTVTPAQGAALYRRGTSECTAERTGFEVVAVFRETLSGIRKGKGKRPVERGRILIVAEATRVLAAGYLVGERRRDG